MMQDKENESMMHWVHKGLVAARLQLMKLNPQILVLSVTLGRGRRDIANFDQACISGIEGEARF
jgi:hypothetical protein